MRFRPWFAAASLPIAQGLKYTPVSSPNIDLQRLGQVALAGNFDAISLYTYVGQTEGINSNGSQSILSSVPNGAFPALSTADANINSMCPFILKDGTFAGVVVGGNFTSLGGVDAQSIALLDPNSTKVTPLPGVLGTVSSILCDQDTNSVYVGGSFKAANSTNAIAWVGMAGWANLPFAGFNAPVTSITKAPNGHIVFGGSFSGLGNATTPTQRDGQVINLATAQVSSGSTTSTPGFDDPRTIVCPSNGTNTSSSTWLLADDSPGYWQANMSFGYQPTKLRIWNTNHGGRGTKTFHFTALPINGIMNLTYIDPATGNTASCDAECPLPQKSNNSYNDFHFANLVGMDAFRIDISEWFGAGAGLEGIELFQDDIFAYAVNDFNEPSCATAGFPSSVTTTGPWTITPSGQSVSEYLTAGVGNANAGSTSIVFKPDIKQSGNYSVTVYTPGCKQDATCSTRGVVNVTATLTSTAGVSLSTEIYQTNIYDKYDQVFLGYVDASSESFRPTVTLTPAQSNIHVVASRVKFGLIDSTGGLNGIFDFDMNQAVQDIDFSKSAINSAGTKLHPNAQVNALLTHNDTIYSAGQFSDDTFENIMAFRANNATSLPGGGLNDVVQALYGLDDFLYAGGNFTGTATGGVPGLNGIAAYQYTQDHWVPLRAGLQGRVEKIVPLQLNITEGTPETTVTFSGEFTSVLPSGSSPSFDVRGFAVWVPSRKDWLHNLNVAQVALAGQLSTFVDVPNRQPLVAGTLSSQGQAITDAASLLQSSGSLSLKPLPIKIKSNPVASSLTKRARPLDQNVTGVVTALYYNRGGRNVTVFGGHFAASATNGSTIDNLLFLNGSNNNFVAGLPGGADTNSTVLALAQQDDLLFAGGSITGKIGDSSVDGLVVYNLASASYLASQPPALQGENVVINTIVTRPGTSEVYMGGSFDTAGSLGCSTVCMFQTSTGQWNPVGNSVGGTVSTLYWASSSKMMATGNLTVGGNNTSVATFDAKKQIWSSMDTSGIPGPVTAFTPENLDGSRFWVAGRGHNGSTYLVAVDGSTTRPIANAFNDGSIVRGLQVLPLTKPHGSANTLEANQALLICGQLDLPGYGKVSGALYNGTAFTPFVMSSTADGSPGSLAHLVSSNVASLPGTRE